MFIRNLIRNILLLLLLICSSFGGRLKAQSSILSQKINFTFVKKESIQSSDSLYFNVLRLQNTSDDTLRLSPQIILPDVFTLMSHIPVSITLPPGGRKHIPFRLFLSKTAYSGIDYRVNGKLVSPSGQLLAQSFCSIKVNPKRDWELIVPEKEINLSPGKHSEGEFYFRLQNTGNIQEKVRFTLTPPEGYKIKQGNRNGEHTSVTIGPGADTLCRFIMIYKGRDQPENSQKKLLVRVSNDLREFKKSLIINSFASFFDYTPQQQNLLSYIEYSRRTVSGLQQIRDELRAKGIVPLKDERKLLYSFMNYNLNEREEIWEQSYFQLAYSDHHLFTGIGQSSSPLGVGMSNRKSMFANLKLNPAKDNVIELHASRGIQDDITCAAGGYQLHIDKFIVRTSVGYSHNNLRKENTSSGVLRSSIPLGKRQGLNFQLRGVQREDYRDSSYFTQGLQGDFNYFASLANRLSLKFKSRFNTAGYNKGNQGQLKLSSIGKYKLGNRNTHLILEYGYNKITNKPTSNSRNNFQSKAENHLCKMALDFKLGRGLSLKTGLWMVQHSNEVLNSISRTHSYNLWFSAQNSGRFNINFSALTGYRFHDETNTFNSFEVKISKALLNVHLNGRLHAAPFGLTVRYDNGPTPESSLYQESDYMVLRVSPFVEKKIFREKLLLQLNADFNKDWVRQQTYMNIRAQLALDLKKHWTVSMEAYLSAHGQQSIEFNDQSINSNFRVGIKKAFNWGKGRKRKKPHYKMDLVFFKDENKNGIKDQEEEGIANGYVQMNKELSEEDDKHLSLSPLLSGDNGNVSYVNIPEGEYNVDIEQRSNPDGYFNFGHSKQKVKVTSDTICYIPYVKPYSIIGDLKIKIANISSGKLTKLANIRVTATDRGGNEYSALTDRMGHFILPVAGKDEYIISINNPYGRKVNVINQNSKVDFNDTEVEQVNFEFVEKRRQVNMKKAKSFSSRKQKRNVQNERAKDRPKANKELTHTFSTKHDEKTIKKGSPEIKQFKPTKETNKSIPKNKIVNAKDSLTGLVYWIYSRIVDGGIKRESYWVVGGFKQLVNAEAQVNRLKENGTVASIFLNEEYGLYYVYIRKTILPRKVEKVKLISDKGLEEVTIKKLLVLNQ